MEGQSGPLEFSLLYRGCLHAVEGVGFHYIGESVDSLCRDGADVQYMQYLSKSRITLPQTRKKLT